MLVVSINLNFNCHYPDSVIAIHSLFYLLGSLKRRVQIVEIVHGSAVTIQALYLLFYLLGSLKRRVQIVEIVHGSIVTIQTLYSLFYLLGVLKHRVQIVEIVHGSAVTIQALHSDVILHVPDGVYGIILGNIHTDHWRFRHMFPENDCIISPICEFFFKGSDIPNLARFHIEVPHIVKDIHHIRKKIKVQHWHNRILSDAKYLTSIQTPEEVYYKINSQCVELFTPHFCQFFISAEGINCCSGRAAMLAFSKMEWSDSGPLANLALYFGSVHHMYNDYRQVNTSADYGHDVVENMLFIIIRSYRTSQQIDLNFDSLSMGN